MSEYSFLRYAPEGKIWVCMSCFAKSKDRLKMQQYTTCADPVLCDEVQPAPGFYALSREETR